MNRLEEILNKEFNWSHDSDPGRYGLYLNLILPVAKQYAKECVEKVKSKCNHKLSLAPDNPNLSERGTIDAYINVVRLSTEILKEIEND